MDFLASIDISRILMQYTVLVFSLCFHEAAHAWMSNRLGDPTARYLGRLSMNPLVHMDPIGTVLFPLLQFFVPIPIIGWAKPVPVNPLHLRQPRHDHMFIAAAGPFSNLLLGVGSIFLIVIFKYAAPESRLILYHLAAEMSLPPESTIWSPILGLLFFAVVINFGLAFFNLIPVPPLDGNWILSGLLPYNAARVFETLQPYGIFILYGLMLFGVLQYVFWPVSILLSWVILL